MNGDGPVRMSAKSSRKKEPRGKPTGDVSKEVLSGCSGLVPRAAFSLTHTPQVRLSSPLSPAADGTDHTERFRATVDSLGFSRTLTGDSRPRGAGFHTERGDGPVHLLRGNVSKLG